MATATGKGIRLDIQALRAVAVLVVIAYHYSFGGFKGGFLGVDIFFVISGFVITNRLLGYQGSFRNSLRDFYLKRAKRILPSSLLVILLTAIFARLVLPSVALGAIAKQSLAASLFLPNLYFAHEQNNYLNQGLDPSPYLHYWSLGVEEQFYLLWPLILLLVFRKKIIPLLVLIPAAIIFGFLLTHHNSVTAFYQPWTRAWEFLVGAALVFLPVLKSKVATRISALFGWAGLAASVFMIDTSHPTPGFTTLLPVFSAALIIAANISIPVKTGLPYIGNISYTLYLVHWPLFIILMSRYPGTSRTKSFLIALLAITLAATIYKYFENPLRTQMRIKRLWQFAIPLGVVASLSFALLESGSALATGSIQISREVPILYADGCHLPFDVSAPKANCFFGDTKSSTYVILAGDSHAAMHFPGINLLAKKNHWKLFTLTKSSCPAAELTIIRSAKIDSACAIWEKNLAREFLRYQPKYIFLAGATEQSYELANKKIPYASAYGIGFTRTLNAAIASGATPVLLSDTSWPGSDSPSCIVRNTSHPSKCDLPLPHSATTAAVKAIVQSKGGVVIDPSTVLCSAGTCPALYAKTNVYRDYSHISVGTSLRLEPYIAAKLGASGRD
ncbi:MAG: acyltransferase family protein [Actinomycetes bacterium]